MPALELSSSTLGTDPNLIAYYKLENANADSGTFNLTNNGTVGFVTAQFNNGARTGTAAGVYLGTGNNLGITGGSATFNFFTRVLGSPTSGNQQFMFAQVAGGVVDVQYDILYFNDAGVLKMAFERQRLGVAGDGTTVTQDLGTTGSHMITMTYDNTTLRGFVDGTQIGSIALSGTGNSADADVFNIGAGRAAANPFNSWIDDFSVFSRALGTQEILDHWLGNDASGGAAGISGYRNLLNVGF